MSSSDFLIVEKEEANTRLDKLLSKRLSMHSRTYFQYLIENSSIFINGKEVKKKYLVKEHDQIEIFFIATPEISLEPENIPLDIIFEDEHILVINKPPGMVVHPAPGHYNQTFVNALLYHCKELQAEDSDSLRPGIVHRLDKDTSGLLIAAKTKIAHQRLIEQFSKREVFKEYLAICVGKAKDKIISKPIGRHPIKRKEMAIAEKGKEAITQVHLLASNDRFSLARIILKTGRTHQIRVHLKSENTPILGDNVYGIDSMNKRYNMTRQLLHAYQIRIKHPVTEKELSFQAPVYEDMKNIILELKASKKLLL